MRALALVMQPQRQVHLPPAYPGQDRGARVMDRVLAPLGPAGFLYVSGFPASLMRTDQPQKSATHVKCAVGALPGGRVLVLLEGLGATADGPGFAYGLAVLDAEGKETFRHSLESHTEQLDSVRMHGLCGAPQTIATGGHAVAVQLGVAGPKVLVVALP